MARAIRARLLAALVVPLLVLAAPSLYADSKEKIDSGASQALQRLRAHSPHSDTLLDQAVAVLVFPDVVKMGFGVGGEYGEGVLWYLRHQRAPLPQAPRGERRAHQISGRKSSV